MHAEEIDEIKNEHVKELFHREDDCPSILMLDDFSVVGNAGQNQNCTYIHVRKEKTRDQ